jgi:hypothetical protein
MGVGAAEYDLFMAAVGYEERGRYISETLRPNARSRFAAAFADRHVHSFEENWSWFHEAGFAPEEVTDGAFPEWLRRALSSSVGEADGGSRYCFDVSSLSRYRIAVIVSELLAAAGERPIEATFVYSLARFSPPVQSDAPNVHVGPVIAGFAGWPREPDRPCSLLVGLGYEHDRALGAVEYVGDGEVWAFLPTSGSREYDKALGVANEILLGQVPHSRRIVYDVRQPYECYLKLESLTHYLVTRANPILFPFGPKIFSVCGLLVAAQYLPRVAVWRVSPGEGETPANRIANGWVVGLTIKLSTNDARIPASISTADMAPGVTRPLARADSAP